MKYTEFPQEIKDRLITMHKLDGSPSSYVSLVMKDGKVKAAFYNTNEETHIDLLETDYLSEYDKTKYRAKLDAKYGSQEARIFDRAEKVPASQYNEMVYWNEEYYYTTEDFIENFVENFDDFSEEDIELIENALISGNDTGDLTQKLSEKYLPKYIWGTKPYKPRDVDIDDIVDKMFSQSSDWDEFNYEIKGLKEFGDALESFKKQNQNTGYFIEDNTRAILLNQ